MRYLIILFIACFCHAQADAAAKKFGLTFKSMKEVKLFTSIGQPLKLDTKNSTKKGSGSIAIKPGMHVELPLFKKKDGTGKVSVKFFDDLTTPDDPNKSRRGPSFGLRNKAGYELSVGVFYATFADGANYYYINHYRHTDKAETPSKWVKHIRVKRVKGWNEFAFEFDARKGLIIKINGKDINHSIGDKKFDWKEIKFGSFDKLVFHGDVKDGKKEQTVYIDDVLVQLYGEGTALK